MTPQVVSVRIQTAWDVRKPLLACVARISRALTSRERAQMNTFSEFTVGDGTVAWWCRPEETEAFEKRLSAALRTSVLRAHRRVRA